MKKTTLIIEDARRSLDVTRDEYALCSYLHYRQGHPKQKVAGYCCDTLEQIADFVGVKKRGLIYMMARMSEKGLVEQSPKGGHYRATNLFIDTESLVQKVHRDGAKSALGLVQKVHRDGAKSAPDIIKEEEEDKVRVSETRDANTHTQAVESSTFAEKENPHSPHVPPAPLSPAHWTPVNPDAEIEKMRTDFTCIERFAKDSRTTTNPEREFAVALEDFALVVKSEKKTYAKASDLRGHFFNWLPFRQKRKEMFGASDTATTTSMRKAKPGESAPLHW